MNTFLVTAFNRRLVANMAEVWGAGSGGAMSDDLALVKVDYTPGHRLEREMMTHG